ncbi:MAG: U32 family peptidase [Desulfobulbaceae bacterium]|nr:U32 family peptidase [Desulfobulbaceae bacterium]
MANMELLAPAGTIETFGAALDGGADAVYVGAPGFNARNLARDLRIEEIGAMIRHCHSLDKKLYVAANSLILERELPLVIDNLAMLQELGPDALIVQDLGLVRLVRQYFPGLKLHGSTLMTAHNSDGVHFQADLGCERVVLAREMTLKEISAISARRGTTELEIFIHGAMCFSYSGLCLFSSYLGGKSGLRGRCVQPCRRAYSSGGKGSGGKGGKNSGKKGDSGSYYFSMNDLTGLEAVPFLKEAGIASLKIEGRLRSAHYVHSIVGAYRKVIDAEPDNYELALAEAKALADQAMSRKTSSGYFFSPQPSELIVPHHSGNMGMHLGRFTVTRKVGDHLTCRFVTKGNLAVGDRLRLHVEPSGERTAFRLKSLMVLGLQQDSASVGSKVSIELPAGFQAGAKGHVEVYKVDGGFRSGAFRASALQTEKVGRELNGKRKQLAAAIDGIVSKVCTPAPAVEPPELNRRGEVKRPYRQRPGRKKITMDWWLKTDSFKVVMDDMPFTPDRYLLSFNKQTVSQAGKMKGLLGRKARMITWALPPLIMENDLGRVSKQIKLLLRTGFRSFQLGHLSQKLFFKGEKAYLFADYTANLLNNQAVAQVSEIGVGATQAGIEMDRLALQELLNGHRGSEGTPYLEQGTRNIPVGLMVYGAPALYTSRLAPDHFQYERQILSPRDEPYIIRKKEGYTQTFPDKPFSLLPYLDELKAMGIKYFVVDITGGTSSKRELQELDERLHNTGRYGKLPTFNYLGKLE